MHAQAPGSYDGQAPTVGPFAPKRYMEKCYRCKTEHRCFALCSENSMEVEESEAEVRICVQCEMALRSLEWPSLPTNFKRKHPDYCTENEVRRDFKKVNKGQNGALTSRHSFQIRSRSSLLTKKGQQI